MVLHYLRRAFFWAGLCCFTSSAWAAPFSTPVEERLREVSESRMWHLLLHYSDRLLTRFESEADTPGFFFAGEAGKTDPLAELKADLEAFADPHRKIEARPGEIYHPQCLYPARYAFLKEELGLTYPDQPCPRFQEWFEKFRITGIRLVFASAYMGNPASTFGHTFLRLEFKPPAGHTVKHDLLDYGINYGALSFGENSLVYALKGLMGGYPGYFALVPYHLKVNEYNNLESRDIWDYALNIPVPRIKAMLRHMWELQFVNFDYFFLTENCSYHLLVLLEIAMPEWRLRDYLTYHVIPSDTIKAVLAQEGAVGKVQFRPSLYRQLRSQVLALSESEYEKYMAYKQNRQVDFDGTESALLLDALINYQSVFQAAEKKELNDEEKLQRRQFLLARAKVKEASPSPEIPQPRNRPDQAHESAKAGLYGGLKNERGYLGVHLRPAYHDLLDNDVGFLPFTQVHVLRMDFRYYPDRHNIRIRELTPIELIAMNPIDAVSQKMSFAMGAGLFSPDDFECNDCMAGYFYGGLGYSAFPIPNYQRLLLYSLLKVHVQAGPEFTPYLRVGASFETAAFWSPVDEFKVGLTGEGYAFPNQVDEQSGYLKFGFEVAGSPWRQSDFRLGLRRLLTPSSGLGKFFDVWAEASLYF